tara:strand:- start:2016 stop:2600 length:585 start_codon:yes stop_codon:yes gene_type:complete
MYLISAQGLDVMRGDRMLLQQLSFAVAAGDVLHIKGRNGAGKSSLIEVLVGLRPAANGVVQRPDSDQFHWIGHRNALHPDLSVLDNLQSWCCLNNVKTDSMEPALDTLGVRRFRSRLARSLSMGQKRRASLARLLLSPRPLWILDEPFSGLDAQATILVGRMMKDHLGTGGGIIVTSHQPLPGRIDRVTILDLA